MFFRLIGYAGAVLGSLGWIICFVIFYEFSGDPLPFWHGIGGLGATLVLSVAFIVIVEWVMGLCGPNHWLYHMTVFGLILFDAGVIIFLLQAWLTPVVQGYTVNQGMQLGNLHLACLILIGVFLLIVVALGLHRVYLDGKKRKAEEKEFIIYRAD